MGPWKEDVGCGMRSEPPSRAQGCELAVFGMCFVSGLTAATRVGGSGWLRQQSPAGSLQFVTQVKREEPQPESPT